MKKADLYKILNELDFHPGKILGQNFLVDDNFLDFIVRAANPQKEDSVLEVGPGFAALTTHLIESGADVTAIEFDHRIAEYLRNKMKFPNFRLIESDVMKVDIEELMKDKGDFRCIANLPYAVSSPFIGELINLTLPPKYMCFMLQKEMGMRLAASPGTKNYGGLSVRIQTVYDVKLLRTVPKQVFHPPPDVDSAIVQFVRKVNYPNLEERTEISRLVRAAFSQRRKQMFKAVSAIYGKDELLAAYEKHEIKKTTRAEELNVSQFIALAETLAAN
jgi:16S rRNA (adenine1518-N6/adenine1519-N6)-dimethyltransferase